MSVYFKDMRYKLVSSYFETEHSVWPGRSHKIMKYLRLLINANSL